MSKSVHIEEFVSFDESVPRALEGAGLGELVRNEHRVIIKPNLVNTSPPPITLPVECAAEIIDYVRCHSDAKILVAEGCGEPDLTTTEVFEALGYADLAHEKGVELVDLNEAETTILIDPSCSVFPEMALPKIIFEGFLISAAVLKRHSLAGVTLTTKNMIGCGPPSFFQQGGHWRKSAFHARIHESIVELNRYRSPDFGFIDGSIGMAEHHLGGRICSPAVARLIAGRNPLTVDREGAKFLGMGSGRVAHLSG